MADTYTPQKGSLAWAVIEFLASHPGAELDAETISAKFNRPVRDVHPSLRPAVQAQALLRLENAEGELAYRLGPTPPGVIRPQRHRHPVLPAGTPGQAPSVSFPGPGRADAAAAFAQAAASTAFAIHLSKRQCHALLRLADSAARNWHELGLAPLTALADKGLVFCRKDANGRAIDFDGLTDAGRVMAQLLKLAGLTVNNTQGAA